MLRSVILCPDEELAAHLERALTALGEYPEFRTVNRYLHGGELLRTLRSQRADIMFLSFECLEEVQEIVQFLDEQSEDIQVIAVHRVHEEDALQQARILGVHESVTFPFETSALRNSLCSTAALIERRSSGYDANADIFSFLPSKAGVGTSTLALNVSRAMTQCRNGRGLLTDFDLNSGMVRFLLKLQTKYSVLDAVERLEILDDEEFRRLVTSLENLDILHAGCINPSVRIQPRHISNLLNFLCSRYKVLCFDLSGNLERYSIEIMHQSKRILVVCTTEIPSLKLAHEKLEFLRSRGLQNRVGVVLNRVRKRPAFDKAEVEEFLEAPVIAMLPNDYPGVNRATVNGTFMGVNSELGKDYREFAAALLGSGAPQVDGAVRKFVDYLLSPALRR